nr:hypothetical protein [Nodosilinea sp. TSF1-S3]MDF0368673.1 hypothetical protein [Nodosilinea sp. TSF1-S3]
MPGGDRDRPAPLTVPHLPAPQHDTACTHRQSAPTARPIAPQSAQAQGDWFIQWFRGG